MKDKTKGVEQLAGESGVIKDFLPPPEQLVMREENVKVTIALKKSSIDFFKSEARKHGTSYQRMMREVIDRYASHYKSA